MGCNGAQSPQETDSIAIYAASSLRHDEGQWREEWHPKDTGDLEFTFDASSRIARQVESGAPCHIVLSASEKWIQRLHHGRHLIEATPLPGAHNRLAVLQHRDSTTPIETLTDLQTLDRIAIGGPNVPLGERTREALGAGLSALNQVIVGRNAEQVFRLVETGEADAAIVYLSDADHAKDSRLSMVVPDHLHAPIVYWMALVEGASRDARRFYDHLAQGHSQVTWLQGTQWARGAIHP